MIILDSYTKSLQIVSTVAELQWTASCVEVTKNCQGVDNVAEVDKENQGLTTAGTITAITAPQQNTNTIAYSDEIEYISVYNSTGVSATVTIQIDISGSPKILFKIVLLAGYQILYNEDSGWQIFDSNGAVPVSGDTVLLVMLPI